TWLPDRRLEPGPDESIAELPADGDLDIEQVGAGLDRGLRLPEGTQEIRLADRGPDPGPARLPEHVDQLRPGGPVRVDPLDGGGDQARGFLLGDRSPVRLTEELGLHAEVDGAR